MKYKNKSEWEYRLVDRNSITLYFSIKKGMQHVGVVFFIHKRIILAVKRIQFLATGCHCLSSFNANVV